MHILLFLPDITVSRLWSDLMVKRLSAKVRLIRDLDQLNTLISTAQFDAAVVSSDLAIDVGGQAVDLLLAANIPTLVQSNELSTLCKEWYARKTIVDYVIGSHQDSAIQAIDMLEHVQRNKHTTILIVDDSAAYRGQISLLLKTQALRILTAQDGEEALEVLAQENVSLMLTDYNMPRMDGLALTKAARQRYGKHELAILVLTASEESQAADFLKHGANDFLSKPFTRAELTCRVNQNLDLIYLMTEMHEMAHRDFLTRLYNRRYFLEQGSLRYQTAINNHKPCAVAMVDIDHFKRINDTWGHDAGDDAIRSLAQQLQHHFQDAHSIVARLGGEEFAILLMGDRALQAKEALETLRQDVASHSVESGDVEIHQTISVGWVLAHDDESLGAALSAADHSLYEAKEAGRNRVVARC